MDADTELLCTLMPSFWWFRESHYIAGDKLRIHATFVARGDCGPGIFNDYLNVEDVKLGIVSRYQNVAVLRK